MTIFIIFGKSNSVTVD